MNDNDIADLRADSLDSLLIAARRRRHRRRAIAVFGGAVGLAIIGIAFGPGRHPEQRSGQVSRITIAPAPQLHPPKPTYVVRTTTTGSLSRISTPAKTSVIRLKTPRTADVRRIDTPALADLFPDNGIAVIHGHSEPPRAIFF